jgi:LmbE family N-acetylglucosaminyl deacetylase
VIAHPDEASFALGAILDAFILSGAKVEVLCLTHRQAWILHGANSPDCARVIGRRHTLDWKRRDARDVRRTIGFRDGCQAG